MSKNFFYLALKASITIFSNSNFAGALRVSFSIQWFVRLYAETTHELLSKCMISIQLDDRDITALLHLHQCRPCALKVVQKNLNIPL